MTLKNVLQQLEKQLKRIEDCESFGMWNFAAYFVGESAAEAESAANVYQSVVSGNKSNAEKRFIIYWRRRKEIKFPSSLWNLRRANIAKFLLM